MGNKTKNEEWVEIALGAGVILGLIVMIASVGIGLLIMLFSICIWAFMNSKVDVDNFKIWIKEHPVVGFLFIVLLLFLFISMIGSSGADEDVSPVKSTVKFLSIGEEGKLFLDGETMIAVCETKEYFLELVDASVANDAIGYKNLIMSTKCYLASSIEPYGNLLVIDRTWGGLSEFRFTYSESWNYGNSAWTYMENIVERDIMNENIIDENDVCLVVQDILRAPELSEMNIVMPSCDDMYIVYNGGKTWHVDGTFDVTDNDGNKENMNFIFDILDENGVGVVTDFEFS